MNHCCRTCSEADKERISYPGALLTFLIGYGILVAIMSIWG